MLGLPVDARGDGGAADEHFAIQQRHGIALGRGVHGAVEVVGSAVVRTVANAQHALLRRQHLRHAVEHHGRAHGGDGALTGAGLEGRGHSTRVEGRRRQQHGAQDGLEQAAAFGPGQHRRDADGIVAHRQPARPRPGCACPRSRRSARHASPLSASAFSKPGSSARSALTASAGLATASRCSRPKARPSQPYSRTVRILSIMVVLGSAARRGSIRARSRRTPRVRNRVRTGDAAWRPAAGAASARGSSPRNTPAWLARSERTCISTTSPGPSASSARKGRKPASA